MKRNNIGQRLLLPTHREAAPTTACVGQWRWSNVGGGASSSSSSAAAAALRRCITCSAARIDRRRVLNEVLEGRPVAHEFGPVLEVHENVRRLVFTRIEHEDFDPALLRELEDELGFALESDREAPAIGIAEKDNYEVRFHGLFAPNFEPVGGLREVDRGEFAARASHHVLDLHGNGGRFLP